ncbi:MAG: GTP-binding protein [Eubacteriales bacterium]|nr:GTP-binding protein [Eubacteriales bacterium]
MIQVYLLTGFLGAGKTTLLQSLIDTYQDKKIGVIINEFGKINIDARLIEKDGIETAELSNGSIFCACIKDKFVDSLIEMSARNIELLFIEASGLADPANMEQILSAIKPHTTEEYLMRGSICIIDGKNFLKMIDMLPALENQVTYANAVILNKADLIDFETEQEIKKLVDEKNPGVKVFVTSYCNTDIREITDNFSVSLKKTGRSTNTYESRPNSFILHSDSLLNLKELGHFLKEIALDSFRIKGFAATDIGPVEINAVGDDIVMRQWKEPVIKTEIVVISSVGIKMLSKISNALGKHLDGRLKLK